MSCRPPCCKRDPERQCPICYTDQVWEMEIPSPIEWKDALTDLIKDGAGDASVGTCGTGVGGRDGSDGHDSHTYIGSNDKGKGFNSTLVGTEDGDSLSRNPPALWNETGICNQFIGDRIYGVTNFKYNTITLIAQRSTVTLPYVSPVNVSGRFYIPSSPILSGNYTKTLQARTGGERGNLIGGLWDKQQVVAPWPDGFEPALDNGTGTLVGNSLWAEPIQPATRWFFSFTGGKAEEIVYVGRDLTGTIPVQNGDDITSADYTSKSLNQRRLFLKIWDTANGFQYHDTNLVLGDYLDGGVLFRVKVTQTSIAQSGLDTNKFSIGTDVEYSIPQSGFIFTKAALSEYNRCQNGEAKLVSVGNSKRAYALPTSGTFAYLGGLQTQGWRLVGHDPQWWINEINGGAQRTSDDQKYLFLLPWINHFEVSDGIFLDTAVFRIAEFKHLNSSGETKQVVRPSDYDDITIPDGTEIQIGEVETGDTFTLGLDNEGEVTTEVSAITFDTPFISTVDDLSPTLSPYEYQTVTFTTSAADTGSSDIVITHDKNNLLIPSPWTLTLTTQSGPVDGGGAGI